MRRVRTVVQSKRKIISMQNDVLSSAAVRPNFVLAPPSCPTCKSGMRLVKATQIALTPDFVDVSTSVTNAAGRRRGRLKGFKTEKAFRTHRTLERLFLAIVARRKPEFFDRDFAMALGTAAWIN